MANMDAPRGPGYTGDLCIDCKIVDAHHAIWNNGVKRGCWLTKRAEEQLESDKHAHWHAPPWTPTPATPNNTTGH